MTNTVYKVVELENEKLYSVYALDRYRTEYIPGELVERPNIFVFMSQEDSESVQSRYDQIWECETQSDPRPAPVYIPDYDYTRDAGYRGVSPDEADKLISTFWSKPYNEDEGPLSLIGAPEGSYLVDDVKLIRRVDDD
jgi:hypothetical protein